jgi:glucose-6-phosphate 1-dehydrogenase
MNALLQDAADTSDNPFRSGSRLAKPPVPIAVVIFGATGDLTARKLVPALFSLGQENRLPAAYSVVGFARRPWSHDEFRQVMQAGVEKHSRFAPADEATWASFSENLFFVSGEFDDATRFIALDEFLKDQAKKSHRSDNRLYYLAAPPNNYEAIVHHLGEAKMAEDQPDGLRRIVIEKPFGHDLASAQHLNTVLHTVFNERQIFRIDHYLGKETVQNILVMRFANAIFEPIWNRSYIDHVQISVAESVGVGGRAGYYDQAGVVRDIFQNHILQILSLICMEPPVAFEADAIRDEKVKVLRAIRPVTPSAIKAQSVRAQYGAGVVDGVKASGYKQEQGVAADSQTATYAALEWYVDNWRWQNVPIYMRSGKRMVTRATEVSIHFKRPPHLLFNYMDEEELRSNILALRIQPDEGISLSTEAKLPGQGLIRRTVTMDFRYGTSFGIAEPPEAYERLLLDAMLGDATLFTRSDEIEWAWRHIDPVLEGWADKHAPKLETYESGTWGPVGADELLARDGRRWRRL